MPRVDTPRRSGAETLKSAFHEATHDVITHLGTPWPPGDAVQFTGPGSRQPTRPSGELETGSLDKQPEEGKGTREKKEEGRVKATKQEF
ncbi:hypothetical protein P7K49_040921 [Saguinus oedipus]|uniref:Uncharacterized protein n=1 Tax=Saguinus oedipus TaxID=9490 RepID=A0ABQ9T9Z8_SAGOE|nr:hypothetical protein P7K49_040921 [Saguinus oedipus]